MVACPGAWKNFEEVEENLSLAEVEQILDAHRRSKWEQNKFLAALKGVELDEYDTSTNDEAEVTAEDIRRRAEAKIRGISEEQVAFEEVGIMIIDENEGDEET